MLTIFSSTIPIVIGTKAQSFLFQVKICHESAKTQRFLFGISSAIGFWNFLFGIFYLEFGPDASGSCLEFDF